MTPHQFRHAEQTLPLILRRQCAKHRDATLLRSPTGTWQYEDVPELVAHAAGALLDAGLELGDRVAVMCANRDEILMTWLAAAWAGLIAVPINPALRAAQLEHVLRSSGASLLIIESAMLEQLAPVASSLPELERIWVVDGLADVDLLEGLRIEPLVPDGPAVLPHSARPGDTLTIFYTGGTTGPSKGVACPHAQSYWWGVNVARQLGVSAEDTLHTRLPLFHTNGLHTFMQALLTGATFCFERKFSVSQFWTDLTRVGGTVTYLLGPMAQMLLTAPPDSNDRAHAVRIALAPGTALEARVAFRERFGFELVDSYGSTETNMITSTRVGVTSRMSMGRVLDGFEAAVVDEEDRPVPRGTSGELVVRQREPYSFFTGYWGDPERTIAAWRNLWFHTGDWVIQNEDETVTFVDRGVEAIRRRGENISSWEVEQALLQHPEVADAAVVGVPSDLGEDDVMAFIVARGEMRDPLALIQHCEDHLAYFAVPRYVEFVSDLPRTPVGRTQKFTLRERGVGPATWDKESAGEASQIRAQTQQRIGE